MQLKGKKRMGAVMSSDAKITKGDASEDALLTESAVFVPNNPTNAGGGGQDEQGEALVVPEKAEVGEKIINEPGVAVKSGLPKAWQNKAYEPVGGKRRAPPGTVARLTAKADQKEAEKKQKRTASSPKILPS